MSAFDVPRLRASGIRFGPGARFELQPAERRLLVDGAPAVLGGRAFDILLALVDMPGHLLTKAELFERVWPGRVVEEGNLQTQVSNLRKLLGNDAIATVPGRGYRFVLAVADTRATVVTPVAAPSTAPAPQLAATGIGPRLVGRAADLRRLQQMLHVGHCVTLLGPSGVGKTSLARAAAAAWPTRCVWLDLAALPAGSALLPTLARGFELPEHEGPGVLAALGSLMREAEAPVLLVLDNAEHVIEACATLAAALQSLPRLNLLVTSQQPLALAGEQRLAVDPLPQPPPGHPGDGDDALALLVERIVAVDRRFVVTPGAVPLLGAICRQLDGLPLALEMAAARAPLLGLQGVHDALTERFALLTRSHRDAAPRHRTLREALAWSHRLLSATEQQLFRLLGVFVGGFSLELVIGVAAGQGERWDIVDRLAALVDHSLVVIDDTAGVGGAGGDPAESPPLYRLLESTRAFALSELEAQPAEAQALRKRLADVLLQRVTALPIGDVRASAQLVREMDTVREVLAWLRTQDERALAIELVTAVCPRVTFTNWRHDVRGWLLALRPWLETAGDDLAALPLQLQARWWEAAAHQLTMQRVPEAHPTALRALALWRQLDAPELVLKCAVHAVRAVITPGAELDAACADMVAALAALPAPTPRQRALVAGSHALACRLRGDNAGALAAYLLEEAAALDEGSDTLLETVRVKIVPALGHAGRHAEAAERGHALLETLPAFSPNWPWVSSATLYALLALERLPEAAALALPNWDSSARFGAPACQVVLVGWLLRLGRAQEAMQLLGHVQRSAEILGSGLESGMGEEMAQLQRSAQAQDGERGALRVQAWLQQGRRLDGAAARALLAAAMPR